MVASGGFLWSAFGWGTMAGGKGFSSLVGASQIFFLPTRIGCVTACVFGAAALSSN